MKHFFIIFALAALFLNFSNTLPAQETLSAQNPSSKNLLSAKDVLRVDEQTLQKILQGELISVDNSDGTNITHYVPKASNMAEKLMEAPLGKQGFALTSVSVVPYPEKWETLSKEQKLLSLYNVLGDISTQEGITYISRRAGYKPKTLFTKSYYIENQDKKSNRVNIEKSLLLPETETRYVFQEDTSFDDNSYKHTYTNSTSEIFLEITNCTPMKYHGVTCLKKEEMKMCFSLYPAKEGIVVSSCAIVKGHGTTVTVLFVKVDLADSFKRRTDAIHLWFKEQLKKSE